MLVKKDVLVLNGQKLVQSMQVHKQLMLQIMPQRIAAHHLLRLFVQLAIDKDQWLIKMDTLPSTLWARDLYDQMHIRSDFRKWFPRMCQYGFIEGRDYEYMPRVRLQDEGGRTVQRYVKDYRITQDMAKKLCKLHHTAVGAAYHPQPFDWDALLGLLHKKPPRRSSYEAQLSDSDSLVTTTQIAKEYGCGAKVFNRLLHLHGVQYRANGQWVLYSEHHGKGYTSSLTFRLQRSDGSEVEKLHTAWTQKGRKFLYHTLKRRGVLPLAEQGG